MRPRGSVMIAAVLAMVALAAACGKKGPPVPPRSQFTAEIRELTAAVEGGEVLLEGRVHGRKSDAASVSGCIVEYAWYPPEEEPCDTCPLDFRLLTTVRGIAAGPDGFSCSVPWTGKAGTHFYRARLVGQGNESGPPSAPASIKREE